MNIGKIKALTFDTGGTILDWHSGFLNTLELLGEKYAIDRNWGKITNQLRKQSLQAMLDLGKNSLPTYNFDDAHRFTVEKLIEDYDLKDFTEDDIWKLSYETPHNFECWPDFPDELPKLKSKFVVVSFTILSYRLIIDTAKKNNISWDAVFSCEGIGKYKTLPIAYETVAQQLQCDVSQCCMVACHNFDLNAAKAVGYKTAFVRRPNEWGAESPPDPTPNPDHDIIVDNFRELTRALGA